MSLAKNKREIERLIDGFEKEAAKFHDLTFSTYTIRANVEPENIRFRNPNHTIMLWQYYGKIASHNDTEDLVENLKQSDLQWGLRGAKLSSFGVIEGDSCDLFVRMAKRAGNLFSKKETLTVSTRVLDEIFKVEKDGKSKPTGATNSNALAVWLNYLLFYISQTNPGAERLKRIEPDPYTLSLLALEHLASNFEITKSDQSSSKIQNIKFKVALSFPNEKRQYVSKVADSLRRALGKDKVFYDFDYQSQLAVPNLDLILQKVYRDNSELIVVFLCAEYARKEWCRLEWRAVRDIIKSKADSQIMFVRFDEAKVDGTFSIDGHIDARQHDARAVVKFIKQRVALNS